MTTTSISTHYKVCGSSSTIKEGAYRYPLYIKAWEGRNKEIKCQQQHIIVVVVIIIALYCIEEKNCPCLFSSFKIHANVRLHVS